MFFVCSYFFKKKEQVKAMGHKGYRVLFPLFLVLVIPFIKKINKITIYKNRKRKIVSIVKKIRNKVNRHVRSYGTQGLNVFLVFD